MEKIYFDGWDSLIKIVVFGGIFYLYILFIIRIFRRTMSEMSPFDFVIAVALGAAFLETMLNEQVSLADSFVVITFMFGVQYLHAWLSHKFKWVNKLSEPQPILVYHNGQYLQSAMDKVLVKKQEIEAAVRHHQGQDSMTNVKSVVFETDGNMSVVMRSS